MTVTGEVVDTVTVVEIVMLDSSTTGVALVVRVELMTAVSVSVAGIVDGGRMEVTVVVGAESVTVVVVVEAGRVIVVSEVGPPTLLVSIVVDAGIVDLLVDVGPTTE